MQRTLYTTILGTGVRKVAYYVFNEKGSVEISGESLSIEYSDFEDSFGEICISAP